MWHARAARDPENELNPPLLLSSSPPPPPVL
jgi:hypothetical protein